eukprot:scaffold2987_cov170-Amphora_coffeaeformis.AAC.17
MERTITRRFSRRNGLSSSSLVASARFSPESPRKCWIYDFMFVVVLCFVGWFFEILVEITPCGKHAQTKNGLRTRWAKRCGHLISGRKKLVDNNKENIGLSP